MAVDAGRRHEGGEPLRPGLVGAQLGTEVTEPLGWCAGGVEERLDERIQPLASGHGRHRRHHDPLLVEGDGVGGHRARGLAAYVGVVGPVGHPADQLAVDVNRPHQGEVVEVGAAVVGVVDRVLDARL